MSEEPDFVPAYAKPDAPGVHLGAGNTAALYQVIGPADTFDDAAHAAIALLREAQSRFPGWPRTYYLDVEGHAGDAGGFTPELYEFQQDFLFSALAPFLSALETPLTGALVNPDRQRDDVPDRLRIGDDVRPHAGRVVPDHAPGPGGEA